MPICCRWLMRFATPLLLLLTEVSLNAATLTGCTVRATDRHTIVLLSKGNVQHEIRPQTIDARERGQAYGTKSRDHLSDRVAGRFVVMAKSSLQAQYHKMVMASPGLVSFAPRRSHVLHAWPRCPAALRRPRPIFRVLGRGRESETD